MPRFHPTAWWRATLVLTTGLLLAVVATGCSASTAPSSRVSTLPTPVSRTIAIGTDRSRYGPSEVIGVTVQNVTNTPFYSSEQYSSCTMLQLQMRVKGVWQMVQPCVGGPPPQVRLLAPKVAFPLSFGPGNAPGNPNVWQVGAYRFVLAYGTNSDGSNATALSYSAGFEVIA